MSKINLSGQKVAIKLRSKIVKYQIFAASEPSEILQEVDSEKKLVRYLLHRAEEYQDFQLDLVRNADDAEYLSEEMDLCEEKMELDYYSELVQSKTFPRLGILRYEIEAEILEAEQIDWPTIAKKLLDLEIREIQDPEV